MKTEAEYSELPWDILDIISKKLDFDDLFQFAGVCKNWRTFHKVFWRNFMSSQAPLLVLTSSYAKKAYFFVSMSEQKVYRSKLDYFWGLSYAGSSSCYLILAGTDKLLLMNPFTRTKKVISTLAIQDNLLYMYCQPLIAFAKGSEEFIIVVLCKHSYSLHIYQSRHSCWVTYSAWGKPWMVVDYVVLNNTLYAITEEGKIGVLSLNSVSLRFLELKNTPKFTFFWLNLVSCDGQLLVVHHIPMSKFDVYKIDLCAMEWIRLETLGDLALFYGDDTNCYALSNPGRWGYQSDSVYYISSALRECKVYSLNNKLKECIVPSGLRPPPRSRFYWLDWYFPHVRDEVDYSLVE
ncbi:F-box protein At2g26160-like isoform X2 [Gastrolobium bilobum]|nr:F-box protein At2g26160-like isoform X2 [Gastrolobium bilobum]XP_061353042.1 F-box protein At2g26160-like isoform X2 [Gastrolobium bilobum]